MHRPPRPGLRVRRPGRTRASPGEGAPRPRRRATLAPPGRSSRRAGSTPVRAREAIRPEDGAQPRDEHADLVVGALGKVVAPRHMSELLGWDGAAPEPQRGASARAWPCASRHLSPAGLLPRIPPTGGRAAASGFPERHRGRPPKKRRADAKSLSAVHRHFGPCWPARHDGHGQSPDGRNCAATAGSTPPGSAAPLQPARPLGGGGLRRPRSRAPIWPMPTPGPAWNRSSSPGPG